MDVVMIAHYAWQNLFTNSDDEEEEKENLIEVENYAEYTVWNYTGRQFFIHFRMSPRTLETLLSKLTEINPQQLRSGHSETSLQKQLLMTIWYLANLESFRSVADRFGLSSYTPWTCFYKVCRRLLQLNRREKIIAWPDQHKCRSISEAFERRHGFPGVLGAIDGTHIPIKAPSKNSASYVNRKGFCSILLQGVCDNNYNFIDCYAGEAGSIHDACVLGAIDGTHIPIKAPSKNSASYVNRKGFCSILLQGVCDNNYNFIDCYAGEAGSIHDACMFRRRYLCQNFNNLEFLNDGHLLGDSAYPLLKKLMVPFKDNGHLNQVQLHFNNVHSKCRVVIEQTFALLKGRFRRLKLLENTRIDLIPLIVIATCVLHNICIDFDDNEALANIEVELEEERIMIFLDHGPFVWENVNEAIVKRNEIANALYHPIL